MEDATCGRWADLLRGWGRAVSFQLSGISFSFQLSQVAASLGQPEGTLVARTLSD